MREKGESTRDPARSETSSTCGHSMRENREVPCLPPGDGPGGRAGKVDDRNPAMNGHGKSDSSVVPTRPPNNAGSPAAEVVEGRGLTKENAKQLLLDWTLRQKPRSRGLLGVREAAQRDKRMRFILHPYPEVRLNRLHPR